MSTSDSNEDLLLEGLRLDERAGPARRISREQAAAMVERAIWSWELERPAASQGRAGVVRAVAIAASLLLAMVGGASAARWYFGNAAKHSAQERATVLRSRASTPPTVEPAAEHVEPALEQASAPAMPHAARQGGREAHDKAEPEDLLQRANRLRAEGRFQSAADTYAQVYERYPRTLSAYAAQVAAGSIELEHLGKPQHARKLFESALHGHARGALDLEARQGLALSLRDLGRDRDEAQALRALITAHGESPAARRAEARLKELSDDAP